jgi:hypothetical protein
MDTTSFLQIKFDYYVYLEYLGKNDWIKLIGLVQNKTCV